MGKRSGACSTPSTKGSSCSASGKLHCGHYKVCIVLTFFGPCGKVFSVRNAGVAITEKLSAKGSNSNVGIQRDLTEPQHPRAIADPKES